MIYKDKVEKTGKTKANYIRKNILTIAMISFAAVCLMSIPVGISVKLTGKVKAEAAEISSRYEESVEENSESSVVVDEE